jgi:hypothetical protein
VVFVLIAITGGVAYLSYRISHRSEPNQPTATVGEMPDGTVVDVICPQHCLQIS